MSFAECQICAGEGNGRNRCSNCGLIICRPCAKQCVQTSWSEEPQCPNCQLVWSKEEQYKLLTKSFVETVVRKRQRDGMLAREMARIPHAVPFARRESYQREFRKLSRTYQSISSEIEASEVHTEAFSQRVTEIQQLHTRLQQLTHLINEAKFSTTTDPFLRCAHPNCNGTVDTSTGECLACQRVTCKHCTMAVDGITTHICDPGTILSIKSIISDCRPCANCSAMTARVEGCPVMWCANCHTFWHWETREIMPSRGQTAPHNPDHRAWLATAQAGISAPRELGDVPCGGVPAYDNIYTALENLLCRCAPLVSNDTLDFARFILKIRDAVEDTHRRVRPRYPLVQDENMLSHDLRVSFLLGDIGQSVFESRVEQRVRKAQYQQTVGPIIEMFTFCGIDILIRVARDCHDESQLARCYLELESLRILLNTELAVVQCDHKRKTPFLRHDWKWVLPYSRKTVPPRNWP